MDPSFLATAFLAPQGRCRKLLVLFAYGRLVSNIERINDAEMNKLEEEATAAKGPAKIGGPIEELHNRDSEQRAVLVEHLPIMTPDHFGLVTSPQLLDQVRSLIQRARVSRSSLPADAADRVYRRLSHHTAKTLIHDHDWAIPRYTEGRAPAHEWLVHLATQAEAEFLVIGDERVALDPHGGTTYVHQQTTRRTHAWRLDAFIEEIESYHFTLDEIGADLPDVPSP